METKTIELKGFLTVRSQGKQSHYHLSGENENSVLIRDSGNRPLFEEMFVPGAKVTVTVEYDETLIVRPPHDHS